MRIVKWISKNHSIYKTLMEKIYNDRKDRKVDTSKGNIYAPHIIGVKVENMVEAILKNKGYKILNRVLVYEVTNKDNKLIHTLCEFDARYQDENGNIVILEIKYATSDKAFARARKLCNRKDEKFKSLFRVTSLLILNFDYSDITMTTDLELKPRLDDSYTHNYIKYADLVNMYQSLYNSHK